MRDGEIWTGQLVADNGTQYPIRDGIPRFLTDNRSRDEAATVSAFGVEWNIWGKILSRMATEEIFYQRFPGLTKNDFVGLAALDAGCGNGKWLDFLARAPAARAIGLDYSDAVEPCYRNTRHHANVVVIQGSILEPPLQREAFDLVISDGVIHHLDDPNRGVKLLGERLRRRGGKLAVWIYGYEGNELYLRLIEPVRSISHRLPSRVLLPIARFLAIPVYVHAHTLNRWLPRKPDIDRWLPMRDYFVFLSGLGFESVTHIVYDQLAPKLAKYYTTSEAMLLMEENGLAVEAYHRPTNNSNSIVAIRREDARNR